MKSKLLRTVLQVFIAFVSLSSLNVQGLTNGLALTPPMGLNTWYYYGPGITENLIKYLADSMSTNGLKAAGYEYLCLDDGWAGYRDSQGVIVPDTNRFPSGMKALADYVHSRGLKFGIYGVWGPLTCMNLPGSCGYIVQDANTYASWGIDYLKYEGCSTCFPIVRTWQEEIQYMGQVLRATGRPIIYTASIVNPEAWMPDQLNSWRGTGDNAHWFGSVLSHLDFVAQTPGVAGPGHWNDPDVLEVGKASFTKDEQRANFSMWCMVAAPLLIANVDPFYLDVLGNREVIAVDQDPAGIQGVCVATNGDLQVWSKPLGANGNALAVALLNRGSTPATITARWEDLNLPPTTASIRDLWAGAFAGTFTNSYSTYVPSHGVQMVKLLPGTTAPVPPSGTNYLSDLEWLASSIQTNLHAARRDKNTLGNVIRLHGTAYTKGLGTCAYSRLDYLLAGLATRYRADIGLDDDACCPSGSVVFRVWGDNSLLFDSGQMTNNSPVQSIDLDISGRNTLSLEVSDAGNGTGMDYADWAGARIVVNAHAPTTPSGLTAAPEANRIQLAWYAVPGAISYNVKRAVQQGGPYQTITNSTLSIFADTTVMPDINYHYVVSAVNASGESADSAEAGSILSAYWNPANMATQQVWNTSGNWTNTSFFPNATGRVAILNFNIISNQTINLNQTITLGSLVIGDADASATYSILGNGGQLAFDNGANLASIIQLPTSKGDTLAATIAIAGGLVISNRANFPLTFAGSNSFAADITAARGLLRIGNSSALGTTMGSTTISPGAALDLNGFDVSAEPVRISGVGVGGSGGLVNISLQATGAALGLILLGDTTIGGVGPIRIGGTNGLLIGAIASGGQAVKLTKTGSNVVTFAAVQFDPALADIDVQQGTVVLTSGTSSLGNPTATLTVRPGATLCLQETGRTWNKSFSFGGDGLTPSLMNAGGSGVISGPCTIGGICRVEVLAGNLSMAGAVTGNGILVKSGSGVLSLSGVNTFGGDTIVNGGTLALVAFGAISNQASIRLSPGTSFDVSQHDGGGIVLRGQKLSGSGTVRGNVTFSYDSTFALDAATVFAFSNSLTLTAGSTTIIPLPLEGVSGPVVSVAGTLTNGGTLMLPNAGSISVSPGTKFKLFNAASYRGEFTAVAPAIPGPGLLWDTSGLSTNGILSVVAATQPLISSCSIVGGNLVFYGTSGGAAGGRPYTVLTTTNLTLPAIQWRRWQTNLLDNNGNFEVAVPIIIGGPPTFFSVQLL